MTDIVEFPEQRRVEREAADWLIMLDRSEEPSLEDLRRLREWLGRSPVHREELLGLARLWGNMNVLTELAVPLGSIGARERALRETGQGRMMPRFATAAVATGILIGGAFLLVGSDPADRLAGTNGVYSTSVGQQQTTSLADGSIVVLNTDSRIQVSYSGRYRDIELLQGEAHFTVAENDALPFRVFASNSRVEAIGTAFAVHLRSSEVRVAVSEGRVALAAREQALESPSIPDEARGEQLLGTLAAGEAGIIADSPDPNTRSAGSLQRIELANVDRMLAWRDGLLAFSGESLETVVAEIGRYTTVRIEIPDPAVRAIPIGGQFPVGEIDAMFAALEENFGLRVQRLSPGQVVLSAIVDAE